MNTFIRFSCAITSLALLVLLHPAHAEDPSATDLKKAADEARANRGCESIPYADLRDRCDRAADFVKQDCKSPGGFKCQELGTKGLAANIDDIKKSIEKLNGQKDDLDRQKTNASSDDKSRLEHDIDDISKQIDDKSHLLDEKNKQLETDRNDAGILAEKGRRCLEARNDVQYLFSSARSQASSLSDEDAKFLVNHWDEGRRKHEEENRNVQTAIEICEKAKSGEI